MSNATGNRFRALAWMLFLLPSLLTAAPDPPNLQFDVFLGCDGFISRNSWFPVTLEIKNDGPPISGYLEVQDKFGEGQKRRMPIELPTGTLKRVAIPAFADSRAFSWDVRLISAAGKLVAENLDIRPRRIVSSSTALLGAMPRTAAGLPVLQPIQVKNAELQPSVARFQPALLPDNPILLEGMDSMYLNSERAADLTDAQSRALEAWVLGGGHLIVAVEQISDFNSSPWFRRMLPYELAGIKEVKTHPELQGWLKTYSGDAPLNSGTGKKKPELQLSSGSVVPFLALPDDMAFEAAPLRVAHGKLLRGEVLAQSEGVPLIVAAPHGAGSVTVLLASPEREPLRSWRNLPVLWACLSGVPARYYVSSDFNEQGGWTSDSVYSAMIETRQVNKLPLGWLVLLLVVYLVVIGPFDQYLVRRLGKPMLTWLTFPAYVVLFSLIIYFIGYKLRSGESEYSELHVVDILGQEAQTMVRGRSYISIYSPSNERYPLKSRQQFGAVRAEAAGGWGGQQAASGSVFTHTGEATEARVYVPVWTSQTYVFDWFHTTVPQVKFALSQQGSELRATVENRTGAALSPVYLAVGEQLYPFGDVPVGQTVTRVIHPASTLVELVRSKAQAFQNAASFRNMAFAGGNEASRLDDLPRANIALSFISRAGSDQPHLRFLCPPGVDLSPLAARGTPLLFAWSDNASPMAPIQQFTPKRFHRQTFWRVALPETGH